MLIEAFSGDGFVDRFVRDANRMATLCGTRPPEGGYDTSFHVTTKIKHILAGYSDTLLDKQISSAKKRGNPDRAARLEQKKKKVDGALAFLRQKFADYVSNLPDKKSTDLRTGEETNPYYILHEYFPDGEPGHIEQDIREIGMVVSAMHGSKQDVHNLMELAQLNGVEIEGSFEDEMSQWYHGKSREDVEQEENEMMSRITHPEYNDVTDLEGGGILSQRIPEEEEEDEDLQ